MKIKDFQGRGNHRFPRHKKPKVFSCSKKFEPMKHKITLILVLMNIVLVFLIFNKISYNKNILEKITANDVIFNVNEKTEIENFKNYVNPLYSDFSLESKGGKFELVGARKSEYPWYSYKKVWLIADYNFDIVSLKVSEYDSEDVKEVII